MTSQPPDYKYECIYATLANDHLCFPSSGQLASQPSQWPSGCRMEQRFAAASASFMQPNKLEAGGQIKPIVPNVGGSGPFHSPLDGSISLQHSLWHLYIHRPTFMYISKNISPKVQKHRQKQFSRELTSTALPSCQKKQVVKEGIVLPSHIKGLVLSVSNGLHTQHSPGGDSCLIRT